MTQVGNQKLIEDAIEKNNILLSKLSNKELNYTEYIDEYDKNIFITTWEDSLSNLNSLLNVVHKEFGLPIISIKITDPERKNRRDIYMLTEDNILYRKIFRSVLNKMQINYNK